MSNAEKELTAKVYAKTAETYGDVPEQKFHEMIQASDKQIDLYQDLGKIGSREHLYALRIKAIALEEGAKVIPLHTSLLLKLAGVSDAGSKIHHSLHA